MLNTQWTVQCETEESDFFKINTGVPQGDSLSANEFTLYFLRELYEEDNDHMCNKFMIITSSELSSISKHDHDKDIDKHSYIPRICPLHMTINIYLPLQLIKTKFAISKRLLAQD